MENERPSFLDALPLIVELNRDLDKLREAAQLTTDLKAHQRRQLSSTMLDYIGRLAKLREKILRFEVQWIHDKEGTWYDDPPTT
jgi:hypothetical protein